MDEHGEIFGLTCRHVVRRGDTPEPLVQPPNSTSVVGAEARSVFGELDDAAIIRLRPGRSTRAGLRGPRPIKGILDPIPKDLLPLPVIVIGACSGVVRGYVDSTDLEIDVEWDDGVIRVKRHLYLYANGGPITTSGDSGALIIETATNRVVGMVRAGDGATFAVGIPIIRVLSDLQVSFL